MDGLVRAVYGCTEVDRANWDCRIAGKGIGYIVLTLQVDQLSTRQMCVDSYNVGGMKKKSA